MNAGTKGFPAECCSEARRAVLFTSAVSAVVVILWLIGVMCHTFSGNKYGRSFLFSPKDTTTMIFKNYLKCELVRPKNTFQLCLILPQMTSGPEKSAVFLDVNVWLALCIVDFWFIFVVAVMNCVYGHCFSKLFLTPSWIVTKVTSAEYYFSSLPLTYR